MIYLALVLMCILVIETVYWLGIMPHIWAIISNSKTAIACILSKQISDAEKEKTARASSLAILKDTFLFAMKLGIAAGVVLLPYVVILKFTEISLDHFVTLLISWSAVIALSVFSIVYIKFRYGHFK